MGIKSFYTHEMYISILITHPDYIFAPGRQPLQRALRFQQVLLLLYSTRLLT